MREGQQKTNKYSQLFSRVERVRLALDLKWDELAQRMDVHRSLFFQVKRAADGKTGGCGFSDRNLIKLEALEREAGIARENQVLDVLEAIAKEEVPEQYQTAVLKERLEEKGFSPGTSSAEEGNRSAWQAELSQIGAELRSLVSRVEKLEEKIGGKQP